MSVPPSRIEHNVTHPEIAANPLTAPFWAAAARGEFLVQVDEATGQAQFYPRPIGLGSGGQALRWTAVSGEGRVAAVTTLPSRTGAATILATVELLERVRVLATLVDLPEARIGDPVRLVWRERPGAAAIFAFARA